MERTETEQALYVQGLELRLQSLEETVEQFGELAESVRPKLEASVTALEAFERLQAMGEECSEARTLQDQHEYVLRCVRGALALIRSGE